MRGIWPVLEALRSGRVVERVLLRRGPLSRPVARGPAGRPPDRSSHSAGPPNVWTGPRKVIIRGGRLRERGARAGPRRGDRQSLRSRPDTLLLALDGVTDVRNIGAISRSAECFGADALIVPMAGSARLGPDAIKSSAGALMRLPVCRVGNPGEEALERARGHGLHIAACTEKGPHALDAGNLGQPLVLVLGSEGEGVSTHPQDGR